MENNIDEKNPFSINVWINNLNYDGKKLRILGSNGIPYFYVNEVGAILEIKQPLATIRNFIKDEEYLSNEKKKELGIQTSKFLYGKEIIDDKMVLLTIDGLYQMAFVSRSDKAKEFTKFVRRLLEKIRLEETEKLRIENDDLRSRLEKYENLMNVIHVYKITVPPRKNAFDYILERDRPPEAGCDRDNEHRILYRLSLRDFPEPGTGYEFHCKIVTKNEKQRRNYMDNISSRDEEICIAVHDYKHKKEYIAYLLDDNDFGDDDIEIEIETVK